MALFNLPPALCIFAAVIRKLISRISYPGALIIALITSTGAGAQVSEPSTLMAWPTGQTIILDGLLTEGAWDSAMRISNFTQRELNFGEPATEKTEVAILYDHEYLYVGVWCYDSEPDKLVAKEMKRDFDYTLDDNFILIFDTYNDERNGFVFVTNPNGARTDIQVFNNGASSNEYWNGVWDVHTTVNNEGWFAEFRIPFYTFKYRTGNGDQNWGINFERNIRRKREQVLWQGWSRNNTIERVNTAGTLTGLNKLRNKQFVEVKPYGLAGGENAHGKNRGVMNAGGDINYLLSPTYRLNLTFNTDFAQVESDRQQVNITRFPLFFPELREFFLEGADYFDMGFGGNRITPFYSRRIGLNENREAVPIIAGGRLLGKEQNRTIGIMSLQTAAQEGRPGTNYTIGSWRQDLGKQSIAGAMTANTFEQGRWHSTTGINGRYSTSGFLGNKNLDIGGATIMTYRSDTAFIKEAYAYRVYLHYSNDLWEVFTSTQRSPAPFNPEIGLMQRQNFIESFALVAFKPRPKKRMKWIRQFDFQPGMFTLTQYNDTRKIQTFEYATRLFGMETRSGEYVAFDHTFKTEGLIADFPIYEDIVLPAGTYRWREWGLTAGTFDGRVMSMYTSWQWGEFYNGRAYRSYTEVLWRAMKFFNVSVNFENNTVHLEQGSFQTDLIGARMEYAVTPNAFGSLLGQWSSADQEMILNFRLRLIPVIGTDFYLILNQVYDTDRGLYFAKSSTILGKLIWRFVV